MIKEFKGQYRWLSNFEPVSVSLFGVTYPSVEHAYMSQKCGSDTWVGICSNPENSAGSIKRASRGVDLVENWEDIKESVMETCLRSKLGQEPYKTRLLQTGDAHIQEGNWWGDKFWGVCLKTGVGENRLGNLIMKIRDELSDDR